MSVEVLNGGALTTVQDLGRYGARLNGFPSCGVADEASARLANALVGNSCDKAVIEMTMLGAEFKFSESCYIAVCGADMKPELNSNIIENNKTYRVTNGDVIKFSLANSGLRTYLAISGGIDCDTFASSRSTDLKCRLGGVDGRKLNVGDSLKIGRKKGHIYNPNYAQVKYTPPQNDVTVRAICGVQYDMFDENGKSKFWTSEFIAENQIDRMGIRLSGEKITTLGDTTDIISDATIKGSVQISADFQPIILMSDAQTTGGYAKIATVITADLPLLAQLTPGAKVRFKQVSVKEAEKAYKKFIKYFNNLCF